ncbi:MAG: hypothetical protein C4289_00305 [Chloroflexota bacterium]
MSEPGVLGIWHGIAPGAEWEVEDWYGRQHHAERLAIPGFLKARRYRALGEGPRIFSRYDLSEAAVGRFSTAIGVPRIPEARGETTRASTSVLPPAEKGTIRRIGRRPCASAAGAARAGPHGGSGRAMHVHAPAATRCRRSRAARLRSRNPFGSAARWSASARTGPEWGCPVHPRNHGLPSAAAWPTLAATEEETG